MASFDDSSAETMRNPPGDLHLDQALKRLESTRLETRIRAVDELADIAAIVVESVVDEFVRRSDSRFLTFERLGRFGSLATPLLERCLEPNRDQEVRTLAAAALMTLGSDRGIDLLLAAVRPHDPSVCVVTRILAEAGVEAAVPALEMAVLECDLGQTAILECLIDGLRKLGHPLSGPIRSHLSGVEPDWLRDSMLK